MVEQAKKRLNLGTVDEEIFRRTQHKKAFKSAAHGMGFGVGLLILLPLLPEVTTSSKVEEMKGLFETLSLWLIAYSLCIMCTFFFARHNVGFVMTGLNLVLVPVLTFWLVVRGCMVLAQ